MTGWRFDGAIAGIGTASGTRIVLGMWPRSPFGPLFDAMIEDAAGHRTLVAPSSEAASFISGTYAFDEVVVEATTVTRDGNAWSFTSDNLRVELRTGRRTLVGVLLTLVPRPMARSELWCRAVNPVARRLRAGVQTTGSGGNGRREWYGALDEHRIESASGRWRSADLGPLRPVAPPVRFGFGSAPQRPALVRVTTTVRERTAVTTAPGKGGR